MTHEEFDFILKYIDFLETHLLEFYEGEIPHDIDQQMIIYQATLICIVRKYKEHLGTLKKRYIIELED